MKRKSCSDLLTIDIGNTTTALAVFCGKKIAHVYRIDSQLPKKGYEYQLSLILQKIKKSACGLRVPIVCSVVPRLTKIVETQIQKQLKIGSKVVGRDVEVPIENNYHLPKQVGQDRLMCAYAAKELYGSPCLVIDLGTAITIDVVSARGVYEGGMIIPGIRLSLASLFEHAALLPEIEKVEVPKHLVGKNTRESMLSGVFYGYGAMLSGLIDMMAKNLKGKPKVIITGGYAELMKQFLVKKDSRIDADLIFKGMQLLI
ncbi:MAG: type III pantothenate kinase [Candidatus Omnitrophica bacterium]|nr:type III pantothenate kinase [Candidatus Omnitrophota bacterium]